MFVFSLMRKFFKVINKEMWMEVKEIGKNEFVYSYNGFGLIFLFI